MAVEVIQFDGHDPLDNLAREEELFNGLRRGPRPVCLFYVNDPCVVLGRNNRVEEWVCRDALAADGVPLLRRFSGGGAVYHDRDCLNFSFMVPKRMVEGPGRACKNGAGPSRYIDFFRGIVIRALGRGGDGLSITGLSDVSLHGRKVSGNAERIAASLVLHHGTVLMRCPLDRMQRYLRIPPGRQDVPHEGFVTGLTDEGWRCSMDEVKAWLAAEFAGTLGMEQRPADTGRKG